MVNVSFSQFYNLASSGARYELALSMLYQRFGAAHCFIGKFVSSDTQVKTVFYTIDGCQAENIVYDLEGTPCKDAKGSDSICAINCNLQSLYRHDDILKVLNIDSYLGITLRALDHTPIGIMVCMFNSPTQVSHAEQAWFKELSHIVGAELNHNLALSSRDLLLKQLAKGERIAKLSSWTWRIHQNKHWFSAEMARLLKHHNPNITLNVFLSHLEILDEQKLRHLLVKIGDNKLDTFDINVSHKKRSELKGLLRIIGRVEWDEDSQERVFSATVQDVSYISALNRQLELTNVVFEHATEAIMITDKNNKIIMVNRAFERLTGYTGHELLGRDPVVLSSGQQDKRFYQLMWNQLSKEGMWKGEIYNRRKNGQIFPEELTLSAVKDEEGFVCNYVAIFRDITQWKRNEAQLTFYANHEPLTGLQNRRSFMGTLEAKISDSRAQQTSCALLFIGLDRFKEVNDVFGPETGDKVLLSVAKRLKNALRSQDTISRYGGDEFAILLDSGDDDSTMLIAEKLSKKLSLPYVFNDLTIEITASTGVAILPNDKQITAANLLRNAAHALGSAKKHRVGSIALHNVAIQNAYLNKIKLRDKLKDALKHKLLTVHYQPIVDARTGNIRKFEALIRWFDDEYGIVSPGRFIPIAEEFGMIHNIGQFVLEQSCHDLSLMHQAGFTDVSISINRSVNEFKSTNNQVALISEAIEKAKLPYHAITIEVTESMATNKYTWHVLSELRAKGVKVALDDFCTGYSSLSNLIENQVDYVKIDKSFVDSLVADTSKQAMIKCLIELSTQLDIRVIAEGVEQAVQLKMLQQFGCHNIQGFYYSPAKPMNECLEMLETPADTAIYAEKVSIF
ncbi:GGDEF domain-containing phosphodiesterase [Pseudoalteromonas sp. MMG005]|uniref:putative bifunctional diguanylate cyclase/phosphodiesterase n=1 Tax=Pseudoalteromonas sp. MMG005 TaxID=2822682 RepID=UPI001FFD8696|nr:GGDEF domain-containing phosphodiesterase [Pseudoalteromonas sp. MMG005]